MLQLDEYAGVGPETRAASARPAAPSSRRTARRAAPIDGAAADRAAEAARHEARARGCADRPRGARARARRPRRVRRAAGAAGVGRARSSPWPPRRARGGGRGVRRHRRRPGRALTTGLGTLYRARELLLLVTGAAKAHRRCGRCSRSRWDRRLPGLAAARPPAADGHLRPRGGGGARRRAPGSRATACWSCSATASPGISAEHRISSRVACAAAPCAARSRAASRCAPSCSPATRRPAGSRRRSR